MVSLVTTYGTFDVPDYWDGDNGLDFRLVDTVNGVSIIRFYAPAYALLLETRDVAANVAGAGFSLGYSFDTGTTDADPGSGKLRLNHATATSATAIHLDDLDSGGSDRSGILALLDDSTSTVKGQVSLNKATDKTAWLTADLTATTDGAGYWTLTLSNVQASGAAPFESGDLVVLGFTRTGDKGDVGSATDIPGQTAVTVAATDDLALIYDTTAGSTRKITLDNLFGSWTVTAMTVTTMTVTTLTVTTLAVDFATFAQAGQHAAEVDETTTGTAVLADTAAPYRWWVLTGDVTVTVAGASAPGHVPGGYRVVATQDGTGGRDVTILPANLLIETEGFDEAAWSKSQATVSADAATAPDGRGTADKVVEDSTTNGHSVYRTTSKATSAITYTGTVFCKAAERSQAWFWLYGASAGDRGQAIFDLSAGTVLSSSAIGAFTSLTAAIEDVGDSWFRIRMTVTTDTSASITFNVGPAAGGSFSYLGDGASGIYVWGAQLVQNAAPLGYGSVGATRAGMVVWPNDDEPDWAAQAAGVQTEISVLPSLDGTIHCYKIRGG